MKSIYFKRVPAFPVVPQAKLDTKASSLILVRLKKCIPQFPLQLCSEVLLALFRSAVSGVAGRAGHLPIGRLVVQPLGPPGCMANILGQDANPDVG